MADAFFPTKEQLKGGRVETHCMPTLEEPGAARQQRTPVVKARVSGSGRDGGANPFPTKEQQRGGRVETHSRSSHRQGHMASTTGSVCSAPYRVQAEDIVNNKLK